MEQSWIVLLVLFLGGHGFCAATSEDLRDQPKRGLEVQNLERSLRSVERTSSSSSSWSQMLPAPRCFLPPDSGRFCAANVGTSAGQEEDRRIQHRYFYSTLNFACEKMPYLGCGGNGNNFRTSTACSRACYSLDDTIQRGLQAQKDRKCFFRYKEYERNEPINDQDVQLEDECAVCTCAGAHRKSDFRGHLIEDGPTTSIHCLVPKCQANICGARDFKCCEPAGCCNEFHTPACRNTNKTCRYDTNREALFDSNFSPKEFPCFRCYCGEGYKGFPSTEVCRETGCGIALDKDNQWTKLIKGCKPVYKEGRCCPVKWACPETVTLGGSKVSGEVEVNDIKKVASV